MCKSVLNLSPLLVVLGAVTLAGSTGAGCATAAEDTGIVPSSPLDAGAGQGGTAGAGGSGGTGGTGGMGGSGGSGGTGSTGGMGGTGSTGGMGSTGGSGGTGGTGGTGGMGGTGGSGGSTVNLFFSQYVEGGYENKALELFNAGSAPVDLSACVVNRYMNGLSSPAASPNTFPAGATLGAGQLYTLCSEYVGSVLEPYCDAFHPNLDFSGDDAVELVCNGVTLDVFGEIGTDPGSAWGSGDTSTANHTLQRKCAVTQGRTSGTASFDPSLEWDGYPQDTFNRLGTRVCP